MAALTFPLAQVTLGDTLPVASVTWQLMTQQELSGLGTGEGLVADLAPMLWEGDVTLRPLLVTAARATAARLDALDGSINSFYLADPLGWWPKADPGGTLYGTATPTIAAIDANRKLVSFSGLPAGYVLSAGDMWHVDYGDPSRRGLFRLVGDVTADGSGDTTSVEVRPHLRSGINAGASVSFARPAAKVKIVPGSRSQQMHNGNRMVLGFTVRQTLAAG